MIQTVQCRGKVLHCLVQRIIKINPFQWCIKLPFQILAKFAAHKQQLLAWVRHLPYIQIAQLGELFVTIAPHLVHQTALAMHDLIM